MKVVLKGGRVKRGVALGKTVVVVGAGASCEFDFPSGVQLNGLIADQLKTSQDDWGNIYWVDRAVDGCFRSWDGLTAKELFQSTKTIREGIHFHQSPDDYLYAMGENQAVVAAGKVGIAASILKAERSSWLSKLHDGDVDHASQTLISQKQAWPLQLIGLRSPGLRAGEIERAFANLAFVNFNYDRCLEHLLYHGLRRTHQLSPEDSAGIVSGIRIIHPYGRVGDLPWQTHKNALPFGGTYDGRLPEISDRIQTLTEARHTESELAEIKQIMSEARRVVFLGFGFHRQNMALLNPSRPSSQGWRADIMATVYLTSQSLRGVFSKRIENAFETNLIKLVDRGCQDFLSENGVEAFSP